MNRFLLLISAALSVLGRVDVTWEWQTLSATTNHLLLWPAFVRKSGSEEVEQLATQRKRGFDMAIMMSRIELFRSM